jgi:hypothetical protein
MGADRRMADSVDRVTRRVDRYTAGLKRPHAELRQKVHDLAAQQWGPPDGIVHLGEVEPAYAVPGRRKDGTVKGKRLIRRFFWNVLRGVSSAVMNVFMLVSGGGVGNVLHRDGVVRGPANAQALGLVDAARPAKSAWLVYAKSYVAVVDSGSDFSDPPTPLQVLWHTAAPDVPKIVRTKQLVTWPDGSEFQYRASAGEAAFLTQERRSRLR